jgi:hypothetical protein
MDLKANLEYDLIKTEWIAHKCQNDKYAQNLYSALCNNRFFKNDEEWTCSWRMSGGIVADLRNLGEDYLDFYCGGNEGFVSSEITHDLLNLGWEIKPYEPKLEPGIYTNKW